MNYLGHAFLSLDDEYLLAGNMMGDFVKGKSSLETYEPRIRTGIMLHRKIDSYTDSHLAVSKAKNIFRETYQLYAGAVTDIAFDHFLANDPKFFPTENELFQFTQTTYQKLGKHQDVFPEPLKAIFPYMQSQNWLYHYRTLNGIQKSLSGLQKRAPNMPPIEEAYKLLVGYYYQLNQYYFEFIDDIIHYVKVELSAQ